LEWIFLEILFVDPVLGLLVPVLLLAEVFLLDCALALSCVYVNPQTFTNSFWKRAFPKWDFFCCLPISEQGFPAWKWGLWFLPTSESRIYHTKFWHAYGIFVASSKLTVVPTTAFLIGTAFLVRRSVFFLIANGKWARKKQLAKIKFHFVFRLPTLSKTFLQRMFLRNESDWIRHQLFEMQMGKKS
jgi:hypothetical protein